MGENRLVPTSSVSDEATATTHSAPQPDTPTVVGGSSGRSRTGSDAALAGAVDLARRAALELAGPLGVGDHLGFTDGGERLATHAFACLDRGYRGWHWAVTVARTPRSRTATVCEVVLLPGSDAILAPPWVPWSDRLAPGDLRAADVLPYRDDDPYLEQGYTQTDDEESDRVALWELGLGRVRVLSPLGRAEAARRWRAGDFGPTAEPALNAAAACASCAYLMLLSGSARQAFGVCANEWSPADGRVVSLDFGCGAHSETDVERVELDPLPPLILDETGAEAVVVLRTEPVVDLPVVDPTEFDLPESDPPVADPAEGEAPAVTEDDAPRDS